MLSRALSDVTEPFVFFFGAGISSALTGRVYNWEQWVRDGIALVPDPAARRRFCQQMGDTGEEKGHPDAHTLTRVLEDVISTLKETPGLYESWMHQAFETSAAAQPALAATLKKMLTFSDVFVTTNYDSLLEQATGTRGVSYLHPELVYPMLEAGKNQYVVHIHGRYSTDPTGPEDSIIATDTQYHQLLDNQGAQFVQNTIGTRTILFIGCGKTTSDPNISLFIRFASQHLHLDKTCYFLYLAGQEPDDLPDHILPVCYGDNYSDLPAFLEQLAKQRLDAFVRNHPFIQLFPSAITPEQKRAFSPSYFAAEALPFQGREEQLACLEAFLAQKDPVLWEPVCGQSGSGKSRLALELCRRAGGPWCAFFIRPEIDAAALDCFVPYRDTLVVLDDFKGLEKNAAALIQKLSGLFAGTPYRLRLLLCERESSTLAGSWYWELERHIPAGSLPAFQAARYQGMDQPFLAVGDLDREALLRMIADICRKNGLPPDAVRDKSLLGTYEKKLEQIRFRPLFVQMFVEAWIENGCACPRFDGSAQLLERIFAREQERWLGELGGDYRLFDAWIRLLLLAITAGKVEKSDLPEKYRPDFDALFSYVSAHSFPGRQRQETFLSLISDMCHHIGRPDACIQPMYPDLLKEYCFLYYLDEDRLTQTAADLWAFCPRGFSFWLERLAVDFPYNDKVYRLIDGDDACRLCPDALRARIHLLDSSTLQPGDDLRKIHDWVDREYTFWAGLARSCDGTDEEQAILIFLGLHQVAQQYGAQDAPHRPTVDKMLEVLGKALDLPGGEALESLKFLCAEERAQALSVAGMTGPAAALLARASASMKTGLGRQLARTARLEQLNTQMMQCLFSRNVMGGYKILKQALAFCRESGDPEDVWYFLRMCFGFGKGLCQFGDMALSGRKKYISKVLYLASQTAGLGEEDSELQFARKSLELLVFEADLSLLKEAKHQAAVRDIFQSAWETPGCESNNCLGRSAVLMLNWEHSPREIGDLCQKLRCCLDQARGEEDNGDSLAQSCLLCMMALNQASGGLFNRREIRQAYAILLRYPDSENITALFLEMLDHSTESDHLEDYMRREVLTAALTYNRYHPVPPDQEDFPFPL